MSPIAEEIAKLADTLVGKSGMPGADRVLAEVASHYGGHQEPISDSGCRLCAGQGSGLGRADDVLGHLRDAGSSVLAAVSVLLSTTPPESAEEDQE